MLCAIAEALRYPSHPSHRLEFAPEFFDETSHVSQAGMEELYTTTFDLNPVATLEVGWHLWGEQYERGRFLADLRGLQEQLGIDSGSELPDHLTVLLPTIAASPSEDLRDKCAKAIEKMLKPLEEQGNPYRHVLRAALRSLAPRSGERVAPEAPGEGRCLQDGAPHPASGHLLPASGEKALESGVVL